MSHDIINKRRQTLAVHIVTLLPEGLWVSDFRRSSRVEWRVDRMFFLLWCYFFEGIG